MNKSNHFIFSKSLFEVLILLLVFIGIGEYAVLYFGAALFFYISYQYITHNNYKTKILEFLFTVIFFSLILFAYFTYILSSAEVTVFPRIFGFISYFLVFALSYSSGAVIKLFIKSKQVQQLIFLSVLSLLLARASIFFGKPFFSSFSGVVYFFISYYLFRFGKLKFYFVILGLILPFFGFFVLLSEIKDETLVVFSYVLVCVLLSLIIQKFQTNRTTRSLRMIIFLLFFTFLTLGNYVFMMNWTEYIYNRKTPPPEHRFLESFQNSNGQKILSNEFTGKTVVLDFWTTSCSVCFSKFPEFENFYQKNKENKDILIYAVNIPARNESHNEILKLLGKFNYEFPVLIADSNFDNFQNRYNITGVPAVIILNKHGDIIYNKGLNNNPIVLVNNLQRIIDGL